MSRDVGRKRPRARGQEDEAAPQAQQPALQAEQAQQAPVPDRRVDNANLARRRAAHFAHFAEDDDEAGAGNVHVGANQARNLGPWSSAVELVNARDQARANREGKQAQAEAKANEAEAADLAWEPSRDPSQRRPVASAEVPTLFLHCLGVLNEYVDCIDSLEGVPDAIKVKLAAHVCNRRKLCGKVAELFAAGGPTELVLPDCHQLDPDDMLRLLQECATDRLEVLDLGACGRGFGDAQAGALASAASSSGRAGGASCLPALRTLRLGGGYRLTDAGLGGALGSLPGLTSLSLPQCSRLTGGMVELLPALTPILRHLDLQDCRGVSVEALIAALPRLASLRSVNLNGLHLVDDTVLAAAAEAPCLECIDVSFSQVTDSGLSALATSKPSLLDLHIDECKHVTDDGLKALAAGCALRTLSVRRCGKLTDEGLVAVAERGGLRRLVAGGVHGLGNRTLQALALHCKESLEHLDVSFCRGFSERALGLLADRCHRLASLVLFSCSQVGHLFLNGHSNDTLTSIKGVGTVGG